jgi:transcriptional regulator with XRE-family HTH domain
MSALQLSAVASEAVVPMVVRGSKPKPQRRAFHRIREVRIQQGVSLRTAARHMQSDVRTARQEEEETTDLTLSQLYQWQKVLDVPVSELLAESDESLSRPIMERARMVRVMKTAQALLEKAPTAPMKRMAQMLVEQLTEVMPELETVSPWHSVGQRRSLDDLGRIAEQTVSMDNFGGDY